MKPEQLRTLQLELLNILLDVQKVCENQGICFYLGEGSLLGAARHRGFIPWDDDVDILMKREDYERFLSVASEELGDRYVVQHPSTVPDYWSTFLKIRVKDTSPRFYQEHIQKLTPYCGPCIDVFPLDYVKRRSSPGQRLQCNEIRLFRRMIDFKTGTMTPFDGKTRLICWLSHCFSLKWLQTRVDREMRRQDDSAKEYIAAFSTFHKYRIIIAPAEEYQVDYAEFEGHRMPVPAGYDQLLTRIYGDWRRIPRENERETKHQYACAD